VPSRSTLDIHAIRRDFPILQERVNGRPLVWFDNAATTQKPQSVIDRIAYFYQHENSNIHRAAHELAARATDAYEHARNVVARFIGAKSSKEIIFVRGTTEGINLIAKTWGEQNIGEGDEILFRILNTMPILYRGINSPKKLEPNCESFLWMIRANHFGRTAKTD
jgi:cysteine desulfurase/selenocysteine lyase